MRRVESSERSRERTSVMVGDVFGSVSEGKSRDGWCFQCRECEGESMDWVKS